MKGYWPGYWAPANIPLERMVPITTEEAEERAKALADEYAAAYPELTKILGDRT